MTAETELHDEAEFLLNWDPLLLTEEQFSRWRTIKPGRVNKKFAKVTERVHRSSSSEWHPVFMPLVHRATEVVYPAEFAHKWLQVMNDNPVAAANWDSYGYSPQSASVFIGLGFRAPLSVAKMFSGMMLSGMEKSFPITVDHFVALERIGVEFPKRLYNQRDGRLVVRLADNLDFLSPDSVQVLLDRSLKDHPYTDCFEYWVDGVIAVEKMDSRFDGLKEELIRLVCSPELQSDETLEGVFTILGAMEMPHQSVYLRHWIKSYGNDIDIETLVHLIANDVPPDWGIPQLDR